MVSADSIVPDPTNPQSFNRYSYVRNNPINFTDPSGHAECGGPFDVMSCTDLGIQFEGEWSARDRIAVIEVALIIEDSIRQSTTLENNGRGKVFTAVFGGTLLSHSTTQEYHNGKAIGARTNNAHKITFYDAAFGTRPISFKYNVAHEFGHSFNANASIAAPTEEFPNRRIGQPAVALRNEGVKLDENDPSSLFAGGSPYIRSPQLGYQLENGKTYPYQQNTTVSANEEIGDMFANWAFNSFASDDWGDARGNWMNNHMDGWVSLAVATNQ